MVNTESFDEWLTRQINAAKAMYDDCKTASRKRRHWDAYMILVGVRAEFQRRTR